MPADSSGQRYEEIEIPEGRVRVTYTPHGWAEMPSVRIQVRDETGHLRQGPEIPVSAIGGVVGAVVDMLSALHARAQREEP
jgi:hypothetical protein